MSQNGVEAPRGGGGGELAKKKLLYADCFECDVGL